MRFYKKTANKTNEYKSADFQLLIHVRWRYHMQVFSSEKKCGRRKPMKDNSKQVVNEW